MSYDITPKSVIQYILTKLKGVLSTVALTGSYNDLSNKPVTGVSGVKGNAETNYRTGNVNITPTNIGLGNVGNFKAVSTVASQGLTTTEQSNARANIGAGTSSFSGNYSDLSGKPSINNGTLTVKQNGTSKGTFTANQSGNTTVELTDTTYESKTAASGGTDVSLVTTGEKYSWNNKSSLALGTASTNAYYGDKGKTAYDHSQSDHSGIKPAFTEASTRANIATGESIATIFGKIKKFFTDLKTVAFTGAYSDLTGKPTIPTVPGVVSTSANGLAPKVTDTSKFLKGDGTWATPTDTNNRKAFFGTCSTAAATAAKEVTLSDTAGWELKAGTIVGVKFSNSNTASSVTLNVNGSGAKSIFYNGSVFTGNTTWITGQGSNIIFYMYDGTNWVWMNFAWHSDGNNAVTQTASTGNADYEVLFSVTADNTTRTEGARKNSNLKFNPSTGNLQATKLNGVDIGSSPKFTDTNTTYTIATGDSAGQIKVTPSSGSAYNVNVKNILKHLGNAGKTNMNDVGRMYPSAGMTNLSDPSNNTDNPMNGTTKSIGWHLYFDTSYQDDPNGSNAWVAQIANKAGTSQWWVRSRSGSTITNGTAWTSNWRHLVTADQAGKGGTTTPVYIDSNGDVQNCSYTLEKSVPSNAVFTDHYAWSDITGKPSSYTPASHTHGNIQNGGTLQTNDITIASGDKLVVTDSSDSSKVARTSISFDGSTTTKALTQKGTWETFAASDTKNTAGSTDTSSKIFLVGATSQAANPQTYSHDTAYVGTDGCLYSGGTKVLTGHQTIKQDGVTGATINRFGTCSTAAATAAKAVSITTGTFTLEAGAEVAVKFSNANTADSPTLNVNSKGAKNIFVNGAQITTGGNKALLKGTVKFIYDGTQWNLIGNYYDTNSVTGVKGNSESSYRTGNVNLTCANIGAATSGHTHTATIAADSGTSALTMAANTKYKLTAGGSTFIFTTPPDTNTWNGMVGATSSSNGTVGYINSTPPKDGYNTKYWRADGLWATPTDNKVNQVNSTDNADCRVLLSLSATDSDQNSNVKKSNKLTFNPSTGNLNVPKVNGVDYSVNSTTFNLTYNNVTYSDKVVAVARSNGFFRIVIDGIKNIPTGALTQIGTLPEGYRPSTQRVINVFPSGSNMQGRLFLFTTGEIKVYNYSASISIFTNAYIQELYW